MSEEKWGKLYPKDMTKDHLMKSRAMLMRNIAKSERWIAKFEQEIINKGGEIKQPYTSKRIKQKD